MSNTGEDHQLDGIEEENDLGVLFTIRYKILEGENFGEIAHCKNWWIIFWQTPKCI